MQRADILGIEQSVMLARNVDDLDIGTSPSPCLIVSCRKSGAQQDGRRSQYDWISRSHPGSDDPDQETHAELLLEDRIEREQQRQSRGAPSSDRRQSITWRPCQTAPQSR